MKKDQKETAMAEARAVSVTRSVEGGRVRGYVEAEDKERIQNRLRRVEGRVRSVQRMVHEEAYCVDVLTQISGAVSALEKVGALAQGPRRACVRASVEDSEKVDEKIGELTAAVERFLRV